MQMNINYHYAKGTVTKHTIDTAGNKTTILDAPKQAAWIEFIDAKSGISPQKIITKRQGDDLLVYFDEKETEPDLIIKNYYDNDELPPILGVDSQGAYHAYVAELAQPELALDKLASGVTAAQVLSSEAYNMAAFPWWHVGGIAAGLGLVGLVAGGGGSGGSNSSAKPEKVVFDPKLQGDGSVSFDLPDIPNDIVRVEITYTPSDSNTPVVAVIEKDPTTGKYISRDPNVKVEPDSGKVTIAEENIQDGTEVSVVVTNDKGMSSDPATTTAGKDYADDTQLEQPIIKELTDKSDRADNNPEELIVEGKTEPLAEVTIKDKNGNVVGKGTADANGDYRIPVVERDKGDNDINSGDELTVIAKADGKNPTETKVTVPNAEDNGVTIKHTGDSVGPENPPVINKDPNTGETKIQFPNDNGDTKEVEIDYTPKGGDSTTPDHINVEKDKDGNVNVEYKPGGNEHPINIDRTSNPDGGSETGVTFTPENQDKPIKIEVEKDKDGNTTTNVELTPDGKDKPINIEVKKDEDGNVVVEIKDQDGKVIGGKDQLPDNVKVDDNGKVEIDTDGNKNTPDTVIDADGTISVPPGVTVKPDGNVEIDTDKNPDTKPIVIDPEGNVTIPDGATEPGTNIDATGKDLAGNPSDTNGVESTEPANPNPNGGTPLPPTLTAKEDGSVTVTLPTADKDGTPVKDGDKVVLTFDKEPAAGTTTAQEVKVTLVKDGDTWKVYPATTPADLVTVNNDGTVTIPETSVADASVVKAYSQGKDDSKDQKSATVQVTVLPDDVTALNINSIHLSSHNDDSPAKLDDITEFTLTGYAGSTDPSAKVQVKFGDKVIGEGVADENGGFALIFREPEGVTINAHDKLTIVATAPKKKPSTAQEKEVPEIVKDSTGYKNDEIAPESPSVTVGKDGDNQVKITPKDPQPGDKIQISVVDNEGNTQEIIVNVDKDGNLVPENNPTAPTVTIKDGVIELDRTQIKDNTNIVVTEKDIAGNTSEPAIKNSGFDEVTANPTIDEIVAHDTDLQADKNPETFTISGTAPAGSKVIAKDEQGNVIGETIADGEGKYQIDAKEKGGNDIDVGSKIYVTAQEVDGDGKPTKGESAVPAVGDVGVATTHENDKQPPQPADILDPKDNGDIDINLPEDAKPGDKATISVGKDTNGNDKLDPDEVKDSVTLEKGEDGKWKPIDGNKDLVNPTEDDNVVTIPSDKVPNDSTVKVETEDLAGNKTEVEDVVDNKLPQTAPPTDIDVKAKDEDNPADGKPDSMTVTGKAEPNSIITVTLNGKEYTGKADDKGNFSLKVAAEDLKVGDSFEVKAQAPNKTPSEPVTTGADGKGLTVPNATEFADNVDPNKAEIGDKTPDGDIPVKLDENAQPGDQYTINVGKDTNSDGKLDPNEVTGSVTLEKQEDGSWKPVSGGNEDLVKKLIENNTALIPSDKVENGDKIKVVGKDNAGNTSEVEKTVGDNTPVVTPTEKTAAPVIDEIKAIDTDSVANDNPEKVIVKGSTNEPNTEIVIKDGEGNIIGQGKSSDKQNEQGKYPFEIEATELTGKDLTTGENLTVTGKADGKSESDAAKMKDGTDTKVPAVENNHEGHPNDTQNPEAPTVLQKEGTDDAEVLLPKDAVTGDQVLISKDVNKDGDIDDNETTVIEKGADGNWTIKDNNDPLNIGNGNIDNNNGKVTVPAETGDKIIADSKDLAGNTSGDSVTILPAKEKSTKPTDIEITAIDHSNPADSSAEVIKVKGKVPNATDGTKVIVYDPKGNILGEGTVQGGNGEFEFSVPNSTNLNAGENLEIKALEKGKELSEAGSGKNGDTNLPEVPRTAAGHPNDPSGPSAPELVNVPKSGAVAVVLPKDANPNDKVEVTFTDEKDQVQTVTLTKKEDGTWESNKENVIPSVKDNLSQPQVVIPENTLKDGKEVSAKSIDGFVDGAEKAAEPVTAGEDAKTNTPAPEEVKITPIDKDAQADGNIDAIRVEGTAEPDSLVVIYQGDKEIGRVQLKDGETKFSIEIGENAGEINVGDPIRIVAKAPGKDVSDPYDTLVPNDMTFLDKQKPQDTPTVKENTAKGEGDVTISVPENPQEPFVSGDKLIVKYTDENGDEQTATLTYNGVGGWRSDDPNVPSIPKGQFSTTIAENVLKDKSEVSATFKDVASNESDDGVATAGYDEITPTPRVDSIVGTDTDNDGNPETVVIKGKLLDESGKPLANVPITVTLEDGTVLGGTNPLILTDNKGEYEVTLTAGQNNVPSPLNKGTTFKVSAEQEGLKDRSDAEIVQAPAVTILKNDITVKGIDLDAHSNPSPEQFSISGTSEKDAKVSAYITVNNQEVNIGEVEVSAEDGKFTLKTAALSELVTKGKVGADFKYSVKSSDTDTKTPTAITLKATKADQSPSPIRTTNAKQVENGLGKGDAEKAELFPNDTAAIDDNTTAKVIALPNGFGGARIELPKASDETFLEVEVSYPPKGGTGANDTLTLTWDGKTWTSNKPDVIANPTEKDGKFIAYLPPEKVNEGTDDAKTNVTVITRDYAGNKSAEQKAELNKPATDAITDQDRTDPPTLVAGSDNNAGDLVATPGADNDKLELKFVDDKGQEQTITIVKDPIAGEWKIVGENPTGATLDNTTGKVTVPANKVKDGSEAEAIGHKGEKPSTAEFKDANNLPTSVHVKVTANADDATPNEADAPTVTGYKDVQENEANYQLKGGATVKVGGDNVEVMINAKGYVEVMTGADGSRHTSGLTVAPFKTTETPTDQGSTKVEEQEIIIRAQKDPATGEWTLQGATKDEFTKAQTLTLTDDEKNGLSEEEQAEKLAEKKASIWNEIPSDIATVDKDGNITLKPNALVDNSEVSAKGYNAKHKEASANPVNVGAEPAGKDVDADEPEIPQTNRDGSMYITPGADNHKVKVTYTKDGQEKIMEIVKDNTGTDGQVEWKVKDGTQLPDNVSLDKNTGKLHFPKGTVDVNTTMTAVGTNKDGYDSDKVDQKVLKDPTSFADAPQAVVDGDKVVVTPGADSEKVEIKGTTNDPVTIVKGDNGEWKFEGNTNPDGITLDPKTGKVTINNDKIGQDGIVAKATDGYEPPKTAESNNGKPVKPFVVDNTANSTEPPELTPIDKGETQGAMTVKPKDDHVEVKVTYTDEQGNTGSITAVRDPQTGKWSLSPTVKVEEKDGKTITTEEPVPATKAIINKDTGEITIMANELKDGETVKAVAKDVKGNYSTEATAQAATDPDNKPLPEDEQPKDNPIVIPTPTPETPTLFENRGAGEVRITAGKGVDYISFNVELDVREEGTNQTQHGAFVNYVLVKNDEDQWEQYVYRIVDKNNNGSIDENEGDDFVDITNVASTLKIDMSQSTDGVFTLKNGTVGTPDGHNPNATYISRLAATAGDKVTPNGKQGKIFGIMIGREGEEFIDLPNDNTSDKRLVVLSDKGSIDDFDIVTTNSDGTGASNAPLYHHVLSNGSDLTSPVITVGKNADNKTTLKIKFDPDTYAMSFASVVYDSTYPEGGYKDYPGFNLVRDAGIWKNSNSISKQITQVDPNDNNVVIIQPTDNLHFYYDHEANEAYRWLTAVKYGAKDTEGLTLGDFFPVNERGDGDRAIGLPNIDLSKATDGLMPGQPRPPQPVEPTDNAEKVDKPTAEVDSDHQGGVKVKPDQNNSGSKYRVDYLDETTGEPKVINVKKEGGKWKFDPDGSTGSIDNAKIKLDENTGELTFAPEAVADGGIVTITVFDSQGNPRVNNSVVALDEPLPNVTIEQDSTQTNIGGVVTKVVSGTNKFEVRFTDEGRNNTSTEPKDHVLVYEKKGGKWELVSVDGDSSNKKIKINGEEKDLSQADNETIKLDVNSGQVTFDKDAIGDKSTVTITPYSKRGTLAGGAAKSVQSAVDKLMTYLDESNVKPVDQVGKLDYVYIDAKHGYYRGLKQLLAGYENNSIPTPKLNNVHSENGRLLDFNDDANIVRIDTSINYTTYPRYQSGYNFDLDFDFKGGNDLLLVGNDVGTGGVDGNGRRVSNIQMGDGNDLFVVGAHNDWFYVVRHKENGTFDIVHWDQYQAIRDGNNPDWEDVGFYAGGRKGGQIRHTEIGMGDGDDTLLVLAVNGGNVADRATYDAIIDLGEGNNRLVVSQEIDAHKSIANSVVTAGSGVDVVKAGGIIEGSSISLGGGDDEVIVGRFDDSTIDLGDGNDWMEVTPMRGASAEIGGNAKVYLGNGNDVFKLGAKLNASDNSIIDGGNGSDFLLFDVSGAIISSTNVRNFEEVGFMQSDSTFNIRGYEVSGIIKVTQADNQSGNKVDLGTAGEGHHESGVNQNNTFADKDGTYWTKSQATVTENGITYDVYTYSANNNTQVWVENGIQVI